MPNTTTNYSRDLVEIVPVIEFPKHLGDLELDHNGNISSFARLGGKKDFVG